MRTWSPVVQFTALRKIERTLQGEGLCRWKRTFVFTPLLSAMVCTVHIRRVVLFAPRISPKYSGSEYWVAVHSLHSREPGLLVYVPRSHAVQ